MVAMAEGMAEEEMVEVEGVVDNDFQQGYDVFVFV